MKILNYRPGKACPVCKSFLSPTHPCKRCNG